MILLGTVALEPNRWATVHDDGRPTVDLSELVGPIAAAGFDGLEVWDRHLTAVPGATAALADAAIPVVVFNSYAGLDPGPVATAARAEAALAATNAGASAVKFNVGSDAAAAAIELESVTAWLADLPVSTRLLCECHPGTWACDDHAATARFLAAAGPPERVGAIVHSYEDPTRLAARFDAYGDRIAHVHLNHLSTAELTVPPLAAVAERFEATASTLQHLGFRGSWTIEFVAGLLTADDRPDRLLTQAEEDLAVARRVLDEVGGWGVAG